MKPSKAQLQLLWKLSRPANRLDPAQLWPADEFARQAVTLRVDRREGWIEFIKGLHKEAQYVRLTRKGQKVIHRYPDRRLSWKQYCQLIKNTMRDLGLVEEGESDLVENQR
ncbi:RNA-binding protein [Alicyclobacillus tolerans]|uniref:RNA-binding protein n=1 Tax=Alicyclobacillus tolerans TaxID=90970 RepID=UPI001F376A92|nr:RNA-binding protein [Alicyclobacillus tolerans]MCF8568163.1 RNA-binding protein [Alicyclobacillus tolerans]